jgi:hypothetical protein
MSSQSVVLVPLLTMHSHVHHIDGASTVLGSQWLPILPRVPRAPRARQKRVAGGQAPLMMLRGLRRGGEMSPETPIVPEASPQGSGVIELPFVP